MAQVARLPASGAVRHSPQRLLSDGPANHGEWQVVLRHHEGTVVLYNRSERTLAIERPANSSYRTASVLEEQDALEGERDDQGDAGLNACPLCRRPFGQKRTSNPHNSFSSVPYALLTSEEPDDHISSDYFHLLSESLQNSPRVLSPEPSRPGTPVVSTSTSTLDDSAFLEGYYERFFVELDNLGRGMSGSVHLCQHVLNGNKLGFYACKKIPVGNSSPSLVKALKEINNLESLRHPNIAAIHHVWLETTSVARGPPVPCLFALMDYANDGSLDSYIRFRGGLQDAHPKEPASPEQLKAQARLRRSHNTSASPGTSRPVHLLSLQEILSLSVDIASGLAFLHSHNMLHLDLKAENILLNRNENEDALIPTALLSDFGSSEARNAINRKHRSGTTGTLDYLAPEAFDMLPNGRPRQHTAELDLWALGLLLHLLVFFQLPYQETEIDDLTSEIKRYRGFHHSGSNHRRHDVPSAYFALMEALINVDPARRPSAAEVLRQLQTIKTERSETTTGMSTPRRTSSALVPIPNNGKMDQNGGRTPKALPSPTLDSAVESILQPSPAEAQRVTSSLRHFAFFAARATYLCCFPGCATRSITDHSIPLRSLLLLLGVSVVETAINVHLSISVAVCGMLLLLLKVYPVGLGIC